MTLNIPIRSRLGGNSKTVLTKRVTVWGTTLTNRTSRGKLISGSIKVSTSSLVVRIVALLATAPTATGMDTLCPTVIGGIPVCVASTRLARLLVHQAPPQLLSVIRILSVVFVVCSPLQVRLRHALLVL
jgi:hypothetical protein